MKKITWIFALLAALMFVFTACPTGGGDGPPQTGEGKFWLSATEGGDAAPNNTVTLQNKGNVYIYFDPTRATFDKIVLKYNIDPGHNYTIAAVYDTFTSGEVVDIHTWGITDWGSAQFWEEGAVTKEIDPANYGDKWSVSGNASHPQNGRSGPEKEKIFGICVNFDDVGPSATNPTATFKLIDVSFTNLGEVPQLQDIVLTGPTKKGYMVGDAFSTAGLVVSANYSYGDPRTINNYTLTTQGIANFADGYIFKTEDTGNEKDVIVSYTEGGITKTASFKIDVEDFDAALTDIVLTTPPAKVVYYDGEIFNADGMVITATYSDKPDAIVSNTVSLSAAGISNLRGYTFLTADGQAWPGKKITVTAKLQDKTKTFEITVLLRPAMNTVVKIGDGGTIQAGNRNHSSIVYDNYGTPVISAISDAAAGEGKGFHIKIDFTAALQDHSEVEIALATNTGTVVDYMVISIGTTGGGWYQFEKSSITASPVIIKLDGTDNASWALNLFVDSSKSVTYFEIYTEAQTNVYDTLYIKSIEFKGSPLVK